MKRKDLFSEGTLTSFRVVVITYPPHNEIDLVKIIHIKKAKHDKGSLDKAEAKLNKDEKSKLFLAQRYDKSQCEMKVLII